MSEKKKNEIGRRNEKNLHAAIKTWYAQPGDQLEVPLGRFVIDIVRGGQLIEIQTRNFSALKSKFARLLAQHPVRLVYPIAREKWIVQISPDDGSEISRRKSPRAGQLIDVFRELLRIPDLISHPNFSLEILLIREEEIRCADGQGSWRRKRVSLRDRRLLEVLESVIFTAKSDFRRFLPTDLPDLFSHKIWAAHSGLPVYQVRRLSYCFRKMGLLQEKGRKGNELLLEIRLENPIPPPPGDGFGKGKEFPGGPDSDRTKPDSPLDFLT